jgi:hypothetical protein
LVEEIEHPIGVNLQGPHGTSQTVVMAPRRWTVERAKGWAAGHHKELERAFGRVASVRPTDAEQ